MNNDNHRARTIEDVEDLEAFVAESIEADTAAEAQELAAETERFKNLLRRRAGFVKDRMCFMQKLDNDHSVIHGLPPGDLRVLRKAVDWSADMDTVLTQPTYEYACTLKEHVVQGSGDDACVCHRIPNVCNDSEAEFFFSQLIGGQLILEPDQGTRALCVVE